MNRAQLTVTALGLVLTSLAILFPFWNGLSYWEEFTDPSGSGVHRRWAMKEGARFFLFTGPKEPQGFSPNPNIAQLITEASFITASTAFLGWMLKSSRRGTESPRHDGMLFVHAALALYLISLPLPAINIAATPMLGGMAAGLSFVGAIAFLSFRGSSIEQGQAPACLIGALANLLFVSVYLALLARSYLRWTKPRYKACSLMASLAAAGTVGVLVPLTLGSEKFTVSIGYVLWVGAATLLAMAAHRLSTVEVAS